MTRQIVINVAEFQQFKNVEDCPNCREILVARPVKRQPTWCDPRDFSAEVGDKVMYLDWPCYLRESRGRDKAASGVLTPVPVKCPFGKVGGIVRLKMPNGSCGPYANVTRVWVERVQNIDQSGINEQNWNSLNIEPYQWKNNPYVWCVILRC